MFTLEIEFEAENEEDAKEETAKSLLAFTSVERSDLMDDHGTPVK